MAENRFKKSIENIERADEGTISSYAEDTELPDNTTEQSVNNILDNIHQEESGGKNYTFYLSTDVADQLSKIAKKKNMSKSKLVDGILREILLK